MCVEQKKDTGNAIQLVALAQVSTYSLYETLR